MFSVHTNQLCPVITSIEIYVRTWERSWRNVYAGPLQHHSPLTFLLRNSITKSRAPHLRKRLRNAEGRRSSDPLSLRPHIRSFRLFCLFPISHWKTHHHLPTLSEQQVIAEQNISLIVHVKQNKSSDSGYLSHPKLKSHLTFNPLSDCSDQLRYCYVTEIPALECSNWKHVPSLSKTTQQKNRSSHMECNSGLRSIQSMWSSNEV